MKISSEQLFNQTRSLFPVYLITGDETLLAEESADFIRELAKKNEFNERQVFHVDAKFDWKIFINATHALSLFSEKEILEFRVSVSKMNDFAKNGLLEYLENPPTDKILIIITEKLPGAATNTKWFKALDQKGLIIQCPLISPNQFPTWVQKRMQKIGLKANQEVIQFISDRTEGNLLAANQEIEKLYLLYGKKEISLDEAMESITDLARYDVFQLIDQWLLENQKQSLRILNTLKNEGMEPTIILWAIVREIRSLITIAQDMKQGQTVDSAMSKHFVWEKRKPIVRTALKRYHLKSLESMIDQSAKIDRMIKGLTKGNVWDEFENIIIQKD